MKRYFLILQCLIILVFINVTKLFSQSDLLCATIPATTIPHTELQSQLTTIIPVAFHIVRLDDGSGDVTDQQLENQINQLNYAYNSSEFLFYLYKIDRTNNSIWSNQSLYNETVEFTMKSELAVNSTHILNVFVCVLQGSTPQGFSRFPWEFPENSYKHGIILRNTVLPGGEYTDYNDGDVLVHEIGHYLGLYHTFQNGCNTQGDEVADTPPQKTETRNCSVENNCLVQPPPNPNNYMDYGTDACKTTFTNGQIARMHAKTSELRPSMYGKTYFTVDQVRESGTRLNGSSVGKWNGSSFVDQTVPFDISMDFTESITLRGKQDIASSPNEKYYQWNLLLNVKNHRSFDAIESFKSTVSQFKSIYSATIQAQAIDGNILGGFVEVRDPWYIDYPDPLYYDNMRNRGDEAIFQQVASATNNLGINTNYKGVIKDLDPSTEPLFYSIQAALTQSISGLTWNFLNWSTDSNAELSQVGSNPPGYDQKAVVFTGENAVVTANYKAHLGSGSTTALSNNGQRKMIRYGSGNHMLVYESAGKIFVTESTNGGSSWSKEVNVSVDSEEWGPVSRNPSIDLYYETASLSWKPIVVWETRLPDNSGYYLFAKRMSGSTWSGLENMLSGTAAITTNDGMPILAYPYVINRKSNGLYILHYSTVWSGDNTQIPGTTSASKNASALYDQWRGTNKAYVVWEENGNIYYRDMTYTTTYNWSSRETIASAYDFVTNTNPSLSMDHDPKIWTTWEYKDVEVYTYRIQTRKRNSANSYGPISSFGSGTISNHPYYLRPSFSSNARKNNDLSLAWYKSTNDVQKVSYENGAWGSISTLATNNQTPQLAMNFSELIFTTKLGFSRGASGSIYPLTALSFAEGGMMEKSSSTAALQFTRGVVTQFDSIAYKIEFGDIRITNGNDESQNIPLAVLSDTVSVNTLTELSDYLRSEPFIAVEESELSLQLNEHPLKGKSVELNGKDIRYSLEFVESGTDKVLYTMSATLLSERKKSLEILPFKFGVTGNKAVYIRLSIHTIGSVAPEVIALNEYADESKANELNKNNRMPGEVIDFIPKDYVLEQNHPNPFNPSTVISFAIPKDNFVTVNVFDALGREVVELMNEYKSSGRYSVVFDAAKLSSGMYVYRLQAGEKTLIKRMMLVK